MHFVGHLLRLLEKDLEGGHVLVGGEHGVFPGLFGVLQLGLRLLQGGLGLLPLFLGLGFGLGFSFGALLSSFKFLTGILNNGTRSSFTLSLFRLCFVLSCFGYLLFLILLYLLWLSRGTWSDVLRAIVLIILIIVLIIRFSGIRLLLRLSLVCS